MRVIVLTGSGLSADSGLPTFRGAGGLYDGVPAERLLSADGYRRDPEAIERWLDRLRVAADRAEPNAAHRGLAGYQRRHPDTLLATQNVDLLLERAGAAEVLHLHGRLDRLRCLGHAHELVLEGSRWDAPERCPTCASRLRSDVVLFDEPAPGYRPLHAALRRATAADALVVIGTQGNVLPVGDFAREFPGLTILDNLHRSGTSLERNFDHVFEASAVDAIGAIVALLEERRAGRCAEAGSRESFPS